MLRGILIIVVIAVLVFCGWELYNRGNPSTLGNGEVVTHNSTSQDRMDTGATDIDGQPVGPTPSRSDAPGTINTVPVQDYNNDNDQAAANQQASPDQQAAPYQQGTSGQQISANQQGNPSPSYTVPSGPRPVSDTIAPNPPNGLAFGGTGKYQWYRQGDLTWRVDTASGTSCIAFATLEQWRLPVVYNHGCGNS